MELTPISPASGILPVFMLFLIPVGGGIPAGVLLAQAKGLPWALTAGLYFLSDVALAFAFEPILLLVVAVGRRIPVVARLTAAIKAGVARRATQLAESGASVFALVMYSFIIDPMTGRAAAMAMGHGFVGGWAIAITGDMMTYAGVAVSTLWVSSYFGWSQNTTMVVVLGGMAAVALLLRYVQGRLKR